MSYHTPKTAKTQVITEYVKEIRTDYRGQKVETTTTIRTKKTENIADNINKVNYLMLSPIHNSTQIKQLSVIEQKNRIGQLTPNMNRSPRMQQMQQQVPVRQNQKFHPEQSAFCSCGQCRPTLQ